MRYQQPQTGPLQIDRSNPITRGLEFYQVGASDGVFTNTGNATTAVNSAGVAKKYSGGSYLSAPNSAIGSTALTLFTLVRPIALGTDMALMSLGAATNDRQLLYITAAGVAAMFSGSAAGATGQAISGTLTAGKLYAIGGRVSSSTSRDVWVSSVKAGADTGNVTPAALNKIALGAYWVNGAPNGSFYLNGEENIALAWSRALSDAELKSLSDNPWQVFASPRRVLVASSSVIDTGLAPGTAALALTGYAPTLAQTANQSVSPAAGALAFSGYAPTLAQTASQGVTPGAAVLAFSGYAPTLGQSANQAVTPGAGTLALTGYAPAVTQSSGLVVIPGAGSLAFTGYAPSIAQTNSMTVMPDAGALAFNGYAPALAQTASQWANPGAGSLTFAGYAPTVAQAVYVDPRYARPQSDVSAGPWTPSAGTSLAAMIDEPAADATDYISTASAGACRIKLAPVADPGTSSGQVFRYQLWSPTGVGILTVRLTQGTTMIAEWIHATLPATATVVAQALTAAQCDAITDYTDLYLELAAA